MIKLNYWGINSSFKKCIAHPSMKKTPQNMKEKSFYPEVIRTEIVTSLKFLKNVHSYVIMISVMKYYELIFVSDITLKHVNVLSLANIFK